MTVVVRDASIDDVLASIADGSGGKAYAGDSKTIGAVYLQISSFF
jgi:hypothetical protein